MISNLIPYISSTLKSTDIYHEFVQCVLLSFLLRIQLFIGFNLIWINIWIFLNFFIQLFDFLTDARNSYAEILNAIL